MLEIVLSEWALDHAVRACYAALRMQESVKQYAEGVFRTHGVPIRIRVGLNSGEVVVQSIGSDLHTDYTAVGQTTHLAARMEQIADPGTTRLTADTLHLPEGFHRLGRIRLSNTSDALSHKPQKTRQVPNPGTVKRRATGNVRWCSRKTAAEAAGFARQR
jgi:class 3 adenylate cyclase